MKTIFTTIVVSALATSIGAVAFMYSGLYDVSALSPHSALSNWAMSTTMQASMQRRAKNIDVPDLGDDALALAGVNDFEAMCVGCHGAPGEDPGPAGQGLNPPAPDLQKAAQHRTPAELFWATKHGIKMTGMPAWGATHDDDALWPVVALMTKLPDLDATRYADLIVSADGHGHHAEGDAGDHAHDDDAIDGDKDEQEPHTRDVPDDEPTEHDHSTHEH